ncbi:MAG: hypothetical protein OXC00_07230, partial [Acidimicrobiaceae bacterium]|nr:hypothetical protein [Acidimicrobiaceae bacterium]
MIPVVTPARMGEIDAAAPESVDVLIERAGAVVARAAAEMMGGRYGRRAVVLAGPGNNGADGRAAAGRLRGGGVRVRVFSATDAPETLPPADLYMDAAFGTGLSRPYTPPQRGRPDAPVLAVDIPSGLHGVTGEVLGGPVWAARRTVTFAALKPGLLFGSGPTACGHSTVADIGLAVGARAGAAHAGRSGHHQRGRMPLVGGTRAGGPRLQLRIRHQRAGVAVVGAAGQAHVRARRAAARRG